MISLDVMYLGDQRIFESSHKGTKLRMPDTEQNTKWFIETAFKSLFTFLRMSLEWNHVTAEAKSKIAYFRRRRNGDENKYWIYL